MVSVSKPWETSFTSLGKLGGGKYRLRYKDFSDYVRAKSDREAERLLAQ